MKLKTAARNYYSRFQQKMGKSIEQIDLTATRKYRDIICIRYKSQGGQQPIKQQL